MEIVCKDFAKVFQFNCHVCVLLIDFIIISTDFSISKRRPKKICILSFGQQGHPEMVAKMTVKAEKSTKSIP